MSDERKLHAFLQTFNPDTRDKIVAKVFSKEGQSRSCKVPSCTWTGKEKQEAFLHFCSKHFEGFSPYACICGQRFAHPSSARRHVKNKLKVEKIGDFNEQIEGISKDAFKLDDGDEKIKFETAVDRWLTSNQLIENASEPYKGVEEVVSFSLCSNDIRNDAIENTLTATPANMLFGKTAEGPPSSSDQLLPTATSDYHQRFPVECPDANKFIPLEAWWSSFANTLNNYNYELENQDDSYGLPSDLQGVFVDSNWSEYVQMEENQSGQDSVIR